MNSFYRWIFSFSLFLIAIVTAIGQVNFVASADARQIVSGQYFSVVFTLENARGANFRAPSFLDFDVVGGPNTSTQMTIINGQRSQKMSYNYTLTSSKIGKYKIGSASVVVNGKTYKTAPLNIEVVKGRDMATTQKSGQSADFVVEAQIDYDTGFVGQQMILKYVLVSTKDIRSYNFVSLPEFEGFFAQEIQNYNNRPSQIVQDGVHYYKRILKVIALFPQQRGKFQLDPAQITLGISDGRRSNSFFFNTRLKRLRVASTALDISIKETPKGAPISFSGAIGDFTMGTRVDKKSVTMDDAVTLTVQIRGFGDGKFIEAPEQPYNDLFDIYDPNLLEEDSKIVGDRLQTTKTYEYLMIPKRTGLIKFNPEMTFYNIDSSKYETIYAQQYRINVLKGSDRELADIDNSVAELPLPPKVGEVYDMNQHFAFSWGHLGANGVLLAALAGLLIAKNVKDKRDNIDPAIKRNLIAKRLAQKKLSSAKVALDKGDVKVFYIKLRQALQEYLADKTDQPTSQLSKDHIRDLLLKYNLDSFLDPLLKIMEKGEQAIYASIAPGHESADYHQSLEIIGEIEVSLS